MKLNSNKFHGGAPVRHSQKGNGGRLMVPIIGSSPNIQNAYP
jgi:hypothetical protein